MEQIRDVTIRRTLKLDEPLKAELFEVTTDKGHSYVGVRFEQQMKGGPVREFHTNLAKLGLIESKAAEYAERGNGAEHFDRAANIELRLKSASFPGRGEGTIVQLAEKDPFTPNEWQTCELFADALKATVQEGKKLASELGIKEWFVLVDAKSLTRDESGHVLAQVVRSFDGEDKARDHLGRSGGGLALYLEPQRREFAEGEAVELWPNGRTLTKGAHKLQSVEHHLGQAEWDRGREGKDHVIARWDDKYNPPRHDARVKFDGTGYEAASLKPEDYKAGYGPNRERGELGDPVWVRIEKDAEKLGAGNIRAISGSREELVSDLRKMQELLDLSRQAFQMERSRFPV